jgi:soluble lytic murein transglycosylase-like protein
MIQFNEWQHFHDSVRWRLRTAGVEIENLGVQRTGGKPITVGRIWAKYADPINEWCRRLKVPCELVVACIATESGGRPNVVRQEPGYVSDEETPGRISAGLMQTLLSTAREMVSRRDLDITVDWLLKPEQSIMVGSTYVMRQSKMTGFDPVLVAAAYNAGGVYYEPAAAMFRLRCYPLGTDAHIVRFCEFLGDFMSMRENCRLAVRFEDMK